MRFVMLVGFVLLPVFLILFAARPAGGDNGGVPRTARASVGGYCYHARNRGNGCARVFHDVEDYHAFVRLRCDMGLLSFRLLRVPYKPRPEEQTFLQRAEVQHDGEVVVRVAVLDDRESERFFGVALARRGIQPVWLRITNNGKQLYRLRLSSLD